MEVDDDIISIIEDDEVENSKDLYSETWNILVVDDDEGVHSATKIALNDLSIFEKPLQLFHCYSVSETTALLKERKDFAVILLDVVMETEDAGLQMVSLIREKFGMDECRIILRTGQPGYAPELTIFNEYDINDYRTKSELNRTRLITSITAAIRSYRQIHTISENRRGLELIIEATSHLMDKKALQSFSQGVLTQLSSLLDLPRNGIVCVQKANLGLDKGSQLFISGAAGNLSNLITHPLSDMDDKSITSAIEEAIEVQTNIYRANYCVIYLQSSDGEGAVYMSTVKKPSEDDQRLLEVFAANMTACFNNVNLLEKLKYDAYFDQLTNLPNKARFILELEGITKSTPDSNVAALIDISHFSDINEGLGTDSGDEFLTLVAKRLEKTMSPHCFVARIRGDIFGVVGNEQYVNPANITEHMSSPFVMGAMNLSVRAHTAFYRMTSMNEAGATILNKIEVALSSAKKHPSQGFEYYSEDQETLSRDRMRIIQHLHSDFGQENLEVWYQPQVDIETGSVWGLEALLRWPDGKGGMVHSPDTFIPLAEYSGLIVDIGEWVLQKACSDFSKLRQFDNYPGHISVNISIPQFRDRELISKVEKAMSFHELGANELVLEITESLAMDDPESVVSLLKELQDMGVKSSLDDFGTGYSSLSYLKTLPINFLKIDKVFIREIHKNQELFEGGDFASTIKMLGDKLNLQVVAEGVETEEQKKFMQTIGCNLIQGFYYAKPMPFNELTEWLTDHTHCSIGKTAY